MGVLSNAIRMGASQPSVSGDYQVERSLRMNATDVTSLKKTPSTKGNQRTWTWAGWVKRSDIATAAQSLFTVYASSNDAGYINFYFHNHHLRLSGWNTNYLETKREFKDSAWYHIVCAVDTTDTISADRVKFYVNGERILVFDTENQPSQNTEFPINKANNHGIGTNVSYTTSTHKFTGYLADVHFIDGLALSPGAFGSFDSAGVFNPKAFAPPAPNDGRTWSDDAANLTNPANAFDGLVGAGATKASSGSSQVSITFDPPLENVVEFEVNYQNSGEHVVAFNGGTLQEDAGGGSTYGYWRTPPATMKIPSTINSFQARYNHSNTNASIEITGIRVNGVVLKNGQVDATTRNNVNNDTTWSSSCSGGTDSGNEHSKAFDGTGATYAYPSPGGSVTFTPSSAIAFKTLRAWITRDANGGTFTLNGSTTYDPPTSGVSWVTIASNGTLTSLAWNRASSGSIGIGVKAIEIDGHVLIDDSDDNSCHLKFNNVSTNAALGTDSFSNGNWTVGNINALEVDYEGMITGVGNWDDGDVSRFFDGSTSTESEFNSGGGNAIFTPNPAITYSGNLEIYTGRTTAMAVELNDSGSDISYVGSGWTTLDTGGGTLSKMKFKNGSAGNQRFGAIRIDGVILTQVKPADVDSCVDSPTNYGEDTGAGGEVRGNYCTLNPLQSDLTSLTQGNLDYTNTGGWKEALGTIGVTSGKWYYEVECVGGDGDGNSSVGFAWKNNPGQTGAGSVDYAVMFENSGWDQNFSTSKTNRNIDVDEGDILGVSLDLDAGTPIMRTWVNNGDQNTINLGGTWSAGKALFPYVNSNNTGARWRNFNFGQRPWQKTCPSGYKALCTQNLDDTFSGDNVNNPSKYFDVRLYTGTGSALTLPANFSTEFLISRRRSQATGAITYDKTSGFSKCLQINSTNALASVTMVSATTESSYTVGTDASINEDGNTYVNYLWDANTSFSNSAGSNGASIASSGYYNADAGFSIVDYTGTGSSGTILHKLTAKPEIVILKNKSAAADWGVYYDFVDGSMDRALWNTNDAKSDQSVTAPTNAVFSTAGGSGDGADGEDYLALCWTPIKGYSAFGTYAGNGGSQRVIYTGFAPKWVMIKRLDYNSDGSWYVMDRERISNGNDEIPLFFNASDAESAGATYNYINPWTSTGFGLANGDSLNGSGKTFIYMAFAEHPMKTSRGR